MNVQVTEWYAPSCPECIEIVENLVRSAVRDSTVTKVSISAGHQHCHPTAPKPKQVGASASPMNAPAPPAVPSGELFTPETNDGVPNGIDPQR
jgi:hypothetical protein